jgi:hypothetical protein
MIHGQRVAVVLLVRDAGSSVAMLVAALPNDVVDDVLVVGEAAAVRPIQAYGLRPRLRTRSPDADGGPVPSYAELLALDADVLALVEPDDRGDPRLVSAMASMIASGACDVVVERRAAVSAAPGAEPSPGMGDQQVPVGNASTPRQPLRSEIGDLEPNGYRACSRSVLEALEQGDGAASPLLDGPAIARAARLGFKVGAIVGPVSSAAGTAPSPATSGSDQGVRASPGQRPTLGSVRDPRVDPVDRAISSNQDDGADPGDPAHTASDAEPDAPGRLPRPTSASARKVTGLLVALVLAIVLPALFGAAHAVSYARIPLIPVSLVREVMLVAPGVRPLTDLQGLAVTADGAIVVAELGGRRLVEFRDGTSGSAVVLAGGDSSQALQRPFDVALTPDGMVLVLDQATGLVHRLYRDGRRLPPLMLGSSGARALAVDASGAMLVADTGFGVVRRYHPDGSPDTGWGDPRVAGLAPIGGAVGVAFVDGGAMAASGVERGVALLDQSGQTTGRAATIGNVGPLARLSAERLLMTDLPTNRVWVLDASGRTVGRLVGVDGDETRFFQPRGIAAPGDGCLYVASDMRIGVYRIEQADTMLVQPGVPRRC